MKNVYTRYRPIKDGSTVIDIGANIGLFSILAAHQASNLKVYSYEPAPEVYSRLQENIRINNMRSYIFPYKLAVAGEEGSAFLYMDATSTAGSTMYEDMWNPENKSTQKVEVKTITLSRIFEENSIEVCDFLKMDCEGAEREILYSASPEVFNKIRYIALEYHNNDGEELASLLNKDGFETRVMKESKDRGTIYAKK